MDTHALTTFIDVARHGSFAAVARLRNIDPSLISRIIGALEDELGFRLFQRTTRRLGLTEAGHAYLERITPLVEELALAGEAAQVLTRQPQGSLRVTTSVAFGNKCIVPLLREFRERYPELSIELLLTDARLDLVGDRIDLAIRLAPRLDTELAGLRLFPTHYRVCASPDYLQRTGAIGHPSELSARDCPVFPFAGFRSRWHFRDAAGEVCDVAIRSSVVISNALGLLEAALDGLGPTLLAHWLVDQHLASGRLVDLFPGHEVSATDFQTAAWVLYPSRAYLPLKVRVFIDFLKEKLGRQAGA